MNNIEKLAEREAFEASFGVPKNIKFDAEFNRYFDEETGKNNIKITHLWEGWLAKAYAQQQTEPVGEDAFDECIANGSGHNWGNHGYKGSIACEWCGKEKPHPPATVPEGYALVPIEPTKEMLVDMFRAWNACDIPKGSDSFTDWRDAYKAMLSASPTPPNAVPLEKYNKVVEQRNDAIKSLGDLSFDCFAGIGVTQPSVKTYNETFGVLDRLRKEIAEAEGEV